jgi:hypothetical protein
LHNVENDGIISYADIQKLLGHMVFIGLEKELQTGCSRLKATSRSFCDSKYKKTRSKITGTLREQINYSLSGCASPLLAEEEYLVFQS